MTTGTLAWIITAAIAVQLLLALLIGAYRRSAGLGASQAATATTVVGPSGGVQGSAPAWEGFREFRVIRRGYEDSARSICSFHLAPLDGKPLPPFRPGQFLTLGIPIGERRLTRCYTLSDRPREDHYRILVKRVSAPPDQPDLPPGVVSNYLHDRLEVGSRLMAKAPTGQFHLIDQSPLSVVLIAGGIGITPMLSILNSLLEQGDRREVWLFYGVRNGRELIMDEHLRALSLAHERFHLHRCFSRPDEEEVQGIEYHHRGRIDIGLLRDVLELSRYQFYICGPGKMLENLVPGLENQGVESADIHYESFGPATLAGSREPAGAKRYEAATRPPNLTFSKSGRCVAWDDAAGSILAFTEAQGVEVTSGCRAGNCGACQTSLEQGEVEYSQPPNTEVAPGHCLLCISIPKSDLTLAL